MKTKRLLAAALALAGSTAMWSGCSRDTPSVYQREYHFGKWEPPQQESDGTWVQRRYDTNTGFCQIRVIPEKQ